MGKSIKSILIDTLKNLEAATDIALEFTYHPYRYVYKDIFEEYKVRRNSLDVTVHRAIKSGWVEKINKKGEVYLRLTTKGYSRLVNSERLTKEEWDGVWRIVVFDIPEKSRKTRNLLRRNLTSLGFVPWQKSVWVSPFTHEKVVSEFLKENNLQEHAVLLKTNELLVEDPAAFKQFVSDQLTQDLKPADWK